MGLIRKGANTRYQWLTNVEIYNLVLKSCAQLHTSTVYTPVAPPAPDEFYGYGKISASGAVTAAAAYVRPTPVGSF